MRFSLSDRRVILLLAAILIVTGILYGLRAREASRLIDRIGTLEAALSALPQPMIRQTVSSSKPPPVPETTMAALLQILTRVAERHGMEVLSVRPKEGFPTGETAGERIQLEVTGKYQSIGEYLGYVEHMEHPVSVIALRIDGVSTRLPRLHANMDLVVRTRGSM